MEFDEQINRGRHASAVCILKVLQFIPPYLYHFNHLTLSGIHRLSATSSKVRPQYLPHASVVEA